MMMDMQATATWLGEHALVVSGGALALAWLLTAGLWQVGAGEGPRARRQAVYWGAAGGAAALFATLAFLVSRDSSVTAFDDTLAATLRVALPVAVLQTASVVTHLGDRQLLTVIAAGVAVVLLWRRRWWWAVAWFAATAGGGVINRVLKLTFERVRPEFVHTLSDASGWSFPSGHASAAMAIYGMGAYFVLRLVVPERRLAVLLIAATIVVVVGITRIMLQVHYASDVLAGWAITSVWLALCIAGLEAIERRATAARAN
ncbi:phosphatase PAP2 family protein [Alcaligenaceae bacterium C4P045]|nr:phosphatase PAP2 family protein [Alcaligenaceae bacterium C4P045]